MIVEGPPKRAMSLQRRDLVRWQQSGSGFAPSAVPTNMPAIGDLFDMFDMFDMFDFNREQDRDR